MLARTADNLFWLARSMERADFIARTIEATLRLEYLPRTGVDDPNVEWESALNAAGAYDSYIETRGDDRRTERDRLPDLRSHQLSRRSATASRMRAPTAARCAPR